MSGYEKPPSKKLKSEPVTAINKGKEALGVDEFEDSYETSTIISSEEIPTCYICFKTFPSVKSLHGHMRVHPNRSYRGMIPPKKSSRPIRTCSYDQGGGSFSASCSSINSVENEDEKESIAGAVYGLMLLSTGDERHKTLPRSIKDEIRVSEVEDVNLVTGTVCCSSSVEKKRKMDQNDEASVKCNDSSVSKVYQRDSSNYNHGNIHNCKECNKAYSSGRALGGHMRYHKKISTVAIVVVVDQTPVSDVVVDLDHAPVVRSFDLNEFPEDS